MPSKARNSPKNAREFAEALASLNGDDASELSELLREAKRELEDDGWQDFISETAEATIGPDSPLLIPLRSDNKIKLGWPLDDFYGELLPYLQLTTEQMLALVGPRVANAPDGGCWFLVDGFGKWCAQQAGRPPEAIDLILVNGGSPVLLKAALRAGFETDRSCHIERALDILTSAQDHFRKASAEQLGWLNPADGSERTRVLEVLEAELGSSTGPMRCALFDASLDFTLREAPDRVAGVLAAVETQVDAGIRKVVARYLFVTKHLPKSATLARMVALLDDVQDDEVDTIGLIDNAFAHRLKQDGTEALTDALFRMILAEKLDFDSLDDTAYAILRLDSTARDKILGRLLAGGAFAGVKAVRDIGLKSLSNELRPIIDFAEFSLAEEEARTMARMIAGTMAILPVTATSLLLSLVRSGPAGASREIEHLIFDPILISYWEEPRTFLDERRPHESARVAAVIEQLLASIDTYTDGIKNAGFVEELYPSERHRFLRALHKEAEAREISKSAQEQSILASLFPTRIILNGDAAIYRVTLSDGTTHRQEQEMQAIEHSHALPRLDAIDPFGFWYRRMLLASGISA